MRSRTRLAIVVAVVALVGVTAPWTTSAAGSLLTGKDIKDNSVTGKDVKNGSLLAGDFGAGQIPAGAKGDQGVPGPPGAPGVSAVVPTLRSWTVHHTADGSGSAEWTSTGTIPAHSIVQGVELDLPITHAQCPKDFEGSVQLKDGSGVVASAFNFRQPTPGDYVLNSGLAQVLTGDRAFKLLASITCYDGATFDPIALPSFDMTVLFTVEAQSTASASPFS